MESIYWVLSRDCNQRCPHCYNNSEPGAPGLSPQELEICVERLPSPDEIPVGRIILSGGEVLVWPEMLFHALGRLHARFGESTQLMVQTNGDLLDEALLDRLLELSVCRIDVSSMDRYHPRGTRRRRERLTALFLSRGMVPADTPAETVGGDQSSRPVLTTPVELSSGPRPAGRALVFAFWGATEDRWIGPLWPRGRARRHGLSKAGPEDEFCRLWSGARNFLNYRGAGSEVNIQLADVYPCCPMTCRPLGCLLEEPLLAMLDRCARHPVFRALNEGRPEAMGETLGISEEEGWRRSRELGNHCLWCDEFFTRHAPELLHPGARTERGLIDLDPPLRRGTSPEQESLHG